MTKKQLIIELLDIPDDAIICAMDSDENYEVGSIEYLENEEYVGLFNSIRKTGNIVSI